MWNVYEILLWAKCICNIDLFVSETLRVTTNIFEISDFEDFGPMQDKHFSKRPPTGH